MRARKGQKEMLTAMSRIITNDDGTQGTLPLDTIAALGKRIEVLWGDDDDIIPVEQAEALGAGFDVTIFRGVGHQLHEEVPELVTAHIALGARIGMGTLQ
jgi:pimeloyl-ACP methyl ester carboxylesterase